MGTRPVRPALPRAGDPAPRREPGRHLRPGRAQQRARHHGGEAQDGRADTRSLSPRWAIELLWGEQWRGAGIVRYALPWPGLIRLDVLRDDIEPSEARIVIAEALRNLAQVLSGKLAEADRLSRHGAERQPGRRTTSRAPALFELLAGFGPLRVAQIETLLGATRLGVRSMLVALDAIGVLERSTIAGVRLYAVSHARPSLPEGPESAEESAFSSEAIGDFNASMAQIERLLTRRGADRDDAED